MLCNRPQNTPTTQCITLGNPYTPHTPNQDAHASLHGTNNIWIGAVADGAGSKPLSHQGSYLATTHALNYIATQQPQPDTNLTQLLQKTITHVRQTLLATPNPHELGTTLALAITTPTQWAATVIGDAFIIVKTPTELKTITSPAKEFANITELITSKTINPTTKTGTTPPTAIALATDGLAQTTLNKKGEASPKFWNPLFSKAQQGTLNLEHLTQHMVKNALLTDDTTILIHT